MADLAPAPFSPAPPPLPVGSSATISVGSRTLPHQMNQMKASAIEAARAPYCQTATPTSTATSTSSSTSSSSSSSSAAAPSATPAPAAAGWH